MKKHLDCPIDKAIPGWKDMVKPYKDDAKFWYGVWQSADRPTEGVLKNIMTRTRNQYHYAIRRIKKMFNSLRAKRLLEASEVDSCQFLKEMKKIKGSKKEEFDLPDVVGNASGELQIVEEFKKVYSALYNSSDTSEGVAMIKDKLNEEIYHNMKGKREDDNSRPKSISENLYTKQFANPPLHVEQEQRTNYTRHQTSVDVNKGNRTEHLCKTCRGGETLDMGRARWNLLFLHFYIIRLFQNNSLVVFICITYKFSL